ncbi:hypothetical protein BDM02DRAFT_3120975 [Thelephora ganbajun]|uniref:Uncharacterized protein n=1 Tax=Thelephora ganbajun TaxID=370292 RepID=A0ACB6Z5I9_THEGA|nr:hypothetical protein BDM02DRAFT_3120975 [Thelephora ganbajun]
MNTVSGRQGRRGWATFVFKRAWPTCPLLLAIYIALPRFIDAFTSSLCQSPSVPSSKPKSRHCDWARKRREIFSPERGSWSQAFPSNKQETGTDSPSEPSSGTLNSITHRAVRRPSTFTKSVKHHGKLS